MVKIVDCTNTRINKTIAHKTSINQASTHRSKNRHALFGFMYFRGTLALNLHMTDRLFSNDSHFAFGAIMSKNRFRFLKSLICFNNLQERTQLWKTNRYVCCKTEGLRWSLLLEVYHWLHKVFSNRNRSWSAYHRKNHLDRLFLHKYWVDKLASWSWHCNSWDIVEREKRNTIWTFWPPKQRDF